MLRLELEKTIVMLDSKCHISGKKSFLKIGPKWSYLGIFGLELEKATVCSILHQHPQIFPNTKSRPKIKTFKFGTKAALIGCFGLEFQKTNVVFEISILKFVNMQSFIQK